MHHRFWLLSATVAAALLVVGIVAAANRPARAQESLLLGAAPGASPTAGSPTSTPSQTPAACDTLNLVAGPDVGGNSYLQGIAAVAASDVWAVGYARGAVDQTLVEHWDGTAWTVLPSPNVGSGDSALTGVAAIAANDVWAVGYSAALTTERTLVEHWDGSDWTVVSSPNPGDTGHLNGVAAAAANDVWAVGHTGPPDARQTLVEHWDGTAWTVVASPNANTGYNALAAVAALGANDVWAVGDAAAPLVEHWDGAAWTIQPGPSVGTCGGGHLDGVAAVAADDVWAVGGYGSFCYRCDYTQQTLVEHWDGTAWTLVSSPNPAAGSSSLRGVAAGGGHDVWAVGWTVPEGDARPLVEHWDGAAWSIVAGPSAGTGSDGLAGVAMLGPGDVWAVGGIVAHWDGRTWTALPRPNPGAANAHLDSVALRAADDGWAVGYYYRGSGRQPLMEHWNGTAWVVVPGPDVASPGGLAGVAAVGANDVWAVGQAGDQPLAEHWDGTAWAVVPSRTFPLGGQLHAVAAVAAGDVWAVGNSRALTSPCYYTYPTLIAHWDGTAWAVASAPDVGPLNGVAVASASDIWAVGWQPLHWNGSAWSAVPGPEPGAGWTPTLTGVAAVATNDVWAVGSAQQGSITRTLVGHWDGTAWTAVPAPEVGPLNAATVVSANDVWAVGSQVLHWDGSAWAVVPGPDPGTLNGVAARSGDDVWAAGARQDGHREEAVLEHTGFTDVHPLDYFYAPVQYLACRGVIAGYADGTFRPYASTTRSQMVKIVVLGFARPITTPPGGGYTFADVPPANPFFAVVETAAAGNIVSGYACGAPGEPCDSANRPYFRPYTYVTRGQLSKIDVVAAGWALFSPPVRAFADVLPNTAFYPFVETAACHGIISGYGCGGPGEPCDSANRPYFRQYANATRGQIAKIVYLSITNTGGCAGP